MKYLDHCIVRKCWRNSVLDITTDPHTNINNDHCMMAVKVRQAFKAKEDIKHEPSLKHASIPEGNEEHILKTFNCSVSEQPTITNIEQQRETNMVDLCAAMDKAARDTLQLNQRTTKEKRKLPPTTTSLYRGQIFRPLKTMTTKVLNPPLKNIKEGETNNN